MRVYQILPVLAYGDAIGNLVVRIHEMMQENGIEIHTYAEVVDDRISIHARDNISELMKKVNADDIIIYHLSTGSDLNYFVAELDGHLVVYYHNITPPHFFRRYNSHIANNCSRGLDGAKFLAQKAEYAIADSEFNKSDLIDMNYSCRIDVIPLLINFDEYTTDIKVSSRADEKVIIYVGRIAPNKCYEDIIRIFYYYKKYYNNKSRLVFVGNYNGYESYYSKLINYIEKLGLTDVFFTGHVSFGEIVAWYKRSDALVCMSEHEGFCVPLVEAMHFGIPIFAYDSTAIPETLGDGGVLLKTKNALENAAIINAVLSNEDVIREIVRSEKKQMAKYDYQRIANLLLDKIYGYVTEMQR